MPALEAGLLGPRGLNCLCTCKRLTSASTALKAFGSFVARSARTLRSRAMLDYCAAHNITSDVEVIPIQQINDAYERVIKGQVKYRFVIDIASLK